jgi:diadenosine tetraphosphate (Ap4A) HIT family hydrolase
MLTSPGVEWPPSFYELLRGESCPMCSEGRPEETRFGARIFAGSVSDAYLQRADIERGYTVSTWRGRHVAEPTELTNEEAVRYWLEVVHVARALEDHFRPVKTNYEVLGNSLPHLHTHLVLRYADDPRPGRPFPFPDEAPSPIEEGTFRRDVEALRALLGFQ